MMKIISAIHMVAIIVPVVANTLSHNERFLMDVVNSKNVARCDIGLAFDYIDVNDRIFADALDERLKALQNVSDYLLTYTKHNYRPILMKFFSTTNNNDKPEVLPNHNRCVIHFLQTKSLNLTLHYLKSAWRADSVGANHFYIIANLKPVYESTILNQSEIFDFQRLFLISKKVRRFSNFEVT